MKNTRTPARFLEGLLAAAGVLAAVSCRPDALQHRWGKERGPVVAHQTFPGDCTLCHEGEGGRTLRKDFSFNHEKETGYRLEASHARAACLRCHNDRGPVAAYVARGCGGCHRDPHASALGPDCQNCHGQVDWRPIGPAARDVQTRFHRIPAHIVPPCASCHVEPGVNRPHVGPAQCRPCHGDGAAPANPMSDATANRPSSGPSR
jgi:hypothetical protein